MAQANMYNLWECVVHYRGRVCSNPEFTLREVTISELYVSLSGGQPMVLCQHEV